MNYMWQQFLEPFDPVLYFEVDGQSIPMRIENVTDNSDLESTDGSEQLVRWDISCQMEGWMKANATKVPTVQVQKLVLAEEVIPGQSIDLHISTTNFNKKTGEIKSTTEETL